jgi:hypothetical protein
LKQKTANIWKKRPKSRLKNSRNRRKRKNDPKLE